MIYFWYTLSIICSLLEAADGVEVALPEAALPFHFGAADKSVPGGLDLRKSVVVGEVLNQSLHFVVHGGIHHCRGVLIGYLK